MYRKILQYNIHLQDWRCYSFFQKKHQQQLEHANYHQVVFLHLTHFTIGIPPVFFRCKSEWPNKLLDRNFGIMKIKLHEPFSLQYNHKTSENPK